MKTKFFMLLAAVLLSASAFAQSENTGTLKGDVNGDGVVDVADINAIIKIMKDGGGTAEESAYYWYIGQNEPTDMSSNPTVTSVSDYSSIPNNTWMNKYRDENAKISTLDTSVTKMCGRATGGDSTKPWYVAVPSDLGLVPTATDYTTPDTAVAFHKTITVNGKVYKVYQYNPGTRKTVYYGKV